MTKRECCEKMLRLYDFLKGWARGLSLNDPYEYATSADPNDFYEMAKVVREVMLDFAVDEIKETEEEKEAAFRERCRAVFGNVSATGKKEPKEEKHPGVIAPVNKKYPATCLKCGGEAEIVDNMFGTSDDWAYCQKCGVSFRLKRGEGEK